MTRWLSLLVLVLACGDDAAVPADDLGTDAADMAPAPAYLLGSRIRTPTGRTFYVSVEADLEARTIDLGRSLELNGFARAYTVGGFVYTMDSESLRIERYRVTADLSLEADGELSMASLGFGSFRPLFVFNGPESALYIDTEQLQVIRWNPAAMVIDEVVPLTSEGLDQGELEILVRGVAVSGGRVFMPLGWGDDATFEVVPRLAVLVLDAATGSELALLETERCIVGGGAFADEAGDIYVLGDGSDGRYDLFGTDTLPPPCLMRIRAGALDFDPDYYVDLRALTGAEHVGSMVGLPDGSAVIRTLGVEIDLETVDNPFDLVTTELWNWTLLDVRAPSARLLDIPLSALPFPPAVVDGELVVFRENAAGDSTLYRVVDGAARESLAVSGEFLQADRIR